MAWVDWVGGVDRMGGWRAWRGVIKFWCGWSWPIKCLYGSKSGRGLKTISISFALRSFSLDSECSLYVFVPDICLFVFLMFISYSSWRGPKII